MKLNKSKLGGLKIQGSWDEIKSRSMGTTQRVTELTDQLE